MPIFSFVGLSVSCIEKAPGPPAADAVVEDEVRPVVAPSEPTCPSPDLNAQAVELDPLCVRTPVDVTLMEERIIPGQVYTKGAPLVGQFTDDDGDGVITPDDTPDIVVVTLNNHLVVLSADGTQTHWEQDLGGALYNTTPAAADVDGDGVPDVVTLRLMTEGWSYGIAAFTGPTGDLLWETPLSDSGANPLNAAISVADFTGNGIADVVVGDTVLQGDSGEVLVTGNPDLSADAALPTGVLDCEVHFTKDRSVYSFVADPDLDGEPTLITGANQTLSDGETIYETGRSDGAVAVANFDSDLQGEIVVVHNWGLCEPGRGPRVRLHQHDGTVTWTWEGDADRRLGPPTVADLDGDGWPEIILQELDLATGGGRLVVLDRNGVLVAGMTGAAGDREVRGVPAAVDLDGDGAAELVARTDTGVVIFGGAGAVVSTLEGLGRAPSLMATPVVADVDGDGEAEIVVVSGDPFGFSDEGALHILGGAEGGWSPVRQSWAQHQAMEGALSEDLLTPSHVPGWPERNGVRWVHTPRQSVHDAVVAVEQICTTECDAGLIHAVVRVGNRGSEPLPPDLRVTLHAWTGDAWEPVLSRTTGLSVNPGETTAGIALTLDASVFGAGLAASVEDPPYLSRLADCDSGSNWVEVMDLCQGD